MTATIPPNTIRQLYDVFNIEGQALPREIPESISKHLCTMQQHSVERHNSRLIRNLCTVISDVQKKVSNLEKKLNIKPLTGSDLVIKEEIANESVKLSAKEKSLKVLNSHDKVLSWQTERKHLAIATLVIAVIGAALAALSALFVCPLPLIIAGSVVLTAALGTGIGSLVKNSQYNKEVTKIAQYIVDLKIHISHRAHEQFQQAVNNQSDATDVITTFNSLHPSIISNIVKEAIKFIEEEKDQPSQNNSEPEQTVEDHPVVAQYAPISPIRSRVMRTFQPPHNASTPIRNLFAEVNFAENKRAATTSTPSQPTRVQTSREPQQNFTPIINFSHPAMDYVDTLIAGKSDDWKSLFSTLFEITTDMQQAIKIS